ncbi:quinone oxidoreductase [Pelagibacteraceae bacterium]|nr:quinone oxidoreductase [Pelagibacteraceae bacterium]
MSSQFKVIKIDKNGGPDVMLWKDLNLIKPDNNEVTIKHTYVGINYIDTYHRSGLYPLPLPTGLGMEASGEIIDIGNNVKGFNIGERVTYVMALGSYATHRNIDVKKIIKIPEGIKDYEAAAIMLKGMTVEYLFERLFKVNHSHTVLFHAIAGGVGLIACQWLKSLGAHVIGTAGSVEKATLAKKYGCDEVILYKEKNFVKEVNDITNGNGVDVVYDGVGKDTAILGLDCLKSLGTMVVFGNSSGNCPPIDPGLLASKGSLFFTRPTLMDYGTKKEDLIQSSSRVFNMLLDKKINLTINNAYKLSDVVNAHKELENRKTTGSIVMKNNY